MNTITKLTNSPLFLYNRPSHLTKHQYKKLLQSLLIKPQKDSEWIQNEKTGEWVNHR